jgi:pyruvate dehydrogenase E1 component alpha subunit
LLRVLHAERQLLRWIEEGRLSGFYHSGRGQEAVPVGGCSALRRDDYLVYAHRGIGYLIAKGLPLTRLFGDFLGNQAGTTRGLGAGIVHIAEPELGILGESGTVGGNFAIAAGAALSAKYRGTDQVCLCFFGEGAANRGTFHEAANAASVWKLPVIWLCENNGYAVSVSAPASISVPNLASRAAGYGMPGFVVDGQDVEAVQEVVAAAVVRARGGDGPTLIEAKTHRFRGHYEGDPHERYRDLAQLEEARKRDPIQLLAALLLSEGAEQAELERLEAEVRAEVDRAAVEALAAPPASAERLHQGVYA